MSSPPETPSFRLGAREVSRAWGIVTFAGVLGTLYGECVGSAPFTSFLLGLGFTPFDLALNYSLSSFAIVFQVVSGIWAVRLRERKSPWMGLLLASRVLFLPVLVLPLLALGDRPRVGLALFIFFVRAALDNTGQPLWFTWMADLLPAATLNRHWAARQRSITAVRIVFAFCIAGFFHRFEASGRVYAGFVYLSIFGVIVGLADILLFLRVPEPPAARPVAPRLGALLLEPLKDRVFRPFLIFLTVWKMSLAFNVSFATIYLMKGLGFSASLVQVISTLAMLGTVLASRFWGLLCDTYGHRASIQLAVIGRGVLLFSLLLCPPIRGLAIPVMLVAFFCEGVAGAGTMISYQTARLQLTPRENRSLYVGTTNVISMGLGEGLGALAAGFLVRGAAGFRLDLGVFRFEAFHLSFAVSILIGLVAWWVAGRIPQVHGLDAFVVLRRAFTANPMRVVRQVQTLCSARRPARIRAAAARALGAMRSPLAIHELVTALDDAEPTVRRAAVVALGRIGTAEASGPLARTLDDTASGVHTHAVRALGRVGDLAALRTLVRRLGVADSSALDETVDALGRIGHPAALVPLISLFGEHVDPALRRRIAQALGRIEGCSSADAVLEDLVSVTHPSQVGI